MVEKLKSIGWVGVAILFGVWGIFLVLFFGTKIATFVTNHQDLLSSIDAVILGIIFLLLILSVIPRIRIYTGSGIVFAAYIYIFLLWLNCLAITYALTGFIGLLFGAMTGGSGMILIAIMGPIFIGQWMSALILVLLFWIMYYGVVKLGTWIASKHRGSSEQQGLETNIDDPVDPVTDSQPSIGARSLSDVEQELEHAQNRLSFIEDAMDGHPGAVFSNVWKTIRLGTGFKNASAFRESLEFEGFTFTGHTYILDDSSSFVIEPEEATVDLMNVSVGEIGFTKGAQYKDICNRAIQFGFQLCPAEVGPQLRLQYKDQPDGEGLRIAMEAITDSYGHSSIFAMGHFDDELALLGITGSPERFYDATARFIFVLPRK